MSQNMQTLLATAAELRSGGYPWDYVASQVHRSVQTVRQWPTRFSSEWKLLYRRAQKKRQEEASAEALGCLRNLLNEEDVRVRVKAADCLLKIPYSPEMEEEEPSPQELEDEKLLKVYHYRIDQYSQVVRNQRRDLGLPALEGEELQSAAVNEMIDQELEGKLNDPAYQQRKQQRELWEKIQNGTLPKPTIGASLTNPLILLWLVVSTILSGILGVREFQRQEMDFVGLASQPFQGEWPRC
jgi:hypothetical protein